MNSRTDWQAEMKSDLVKVGESEDGEDLICAEYRVTCVNSFGDRYVSHFSTFDKSIAIYHSIKVADYLRHQNADPSKSDKWFRGNAVYGSAAYTAYGQAEEVAWEKAVDGVR